MVAERQKLFLIINRLSHAGGSMDALSMAYYLTHRYQITILYGGKENDEKDAPLTSSDTTITFIEISSLRRSILPFKDFISFRKIYSLIKKHRPEIVHTIGFKTGLLGRSAAKICRVPVIVHTFHGHIFHSYYSNTISRFICAIEKSLARISDYIIAISPQQAFELYSTYRIAPKHKIKTIFIGIDKKNYGIPEDKKPAFRSHYNVPQTATVIAIISRLVAIKNHSFFIQIAKKILEQESNVYLFIIGDGKEKPGIQKKLTDQHLQWQEGSAKNNDTRIFFTSWITDIASALTDIDIVVLTSLNEGTPVSLIEAQLFGKPVVATNVGGVRDTIVNNETGFLIDNFSVDDFVNQLQCLIHDKQVRNEMGNNGKIFVAERFSKQKEVAAIDALYIRCLQQKNAIAK